ncbi:MAG TPA: hypothetical protein VNC41_12570 [Acidimicrobiia bacterium]|nr:hypothetical protein [Acidimicrobiia bacterium]
MLRRGVIEHEGATPVLRRRVFAFALLVILATTLGACGQDDPKAQPTDKVLLLGDSIMDQEGGPAAFALRQAGIDAEKIAYWGSGLLTRDQYENGKTRYGPPTAGSEDVHWLTKAKELVKAEQPGLVVVAMNHNLHAPYPTAADGHEIRSPRDPAAAEMIATQTRELLDILKGSRVAFVTPPPEPGEKKPADNPIWAAMLPVLQEENVDIIDITPAIAPDGVRVESLPDCFGGPDRVRRAGEVHYERFGAGLAGTRLADGVAQLLGKDLPNGAPGDHVVALVATESGEGYWVVQCDGSVFHFGDAPPITGVRGTKSPIVGAVRSFDGLWLVRRDGTIKSVGGADDIAFEVKPTDDLVSATATPANDGIVALTNRGSVVSTNGDAPYPAVARAVGVATLAPNGVWRLQSDGHVDGVDGAPSTDTELKNAVAIASVPEGTGFWAVDRGGIVATYGDAKNDGDAKSEPLPPEVAKVFPKGNPIPVVAITAAPNGGYWITRDNGLVTALGGAPKLGGTNGLALFTP